MRVVRGRADTIARDRSVSSRLLDWASEGETVVRAWRPHRQVAFGRRDANAAGSDRAKRIARERGFPPVERDVGGRAVAYTGTTVAFARATPATIRGDVDARYEGVTGAIRAALSDLGVDAREGEPPDSFCPGTHSLQARGKLAGLAQRVRKDAAITAGILVVDDHEAIADVLDPIYEALDVPFDPDSVGSVERAGGDADPDHVVETIETGLVGEETPEAVLAEAVLQE